MDSYLNNSKTSNIYLICPNCNSFFPNKSSNSSNIPFEKNFESFTYSIFSNIKSFHKNLSNIITNIKNTTLGLENQFKHVKSLMKLIMVKNSNNMERYNQLNDRIDIICESKKILDDNITLVNENLNIFVNDNHKIFKKIKYQISQKNDINIDIKKYNDINKNIINLNSLKEKKLNSNNNKLVYNNLDNLVKNIHLKEYEPNNKHPRSNNTLIFPNNINQNIFNYTITSKEFQKMKKAQNFGIFNYNNANKKKSENIRKRESENEIKINKLTRSTSTPEMRNKKILFNKYKTNNFEDDDIDTLCYKIEDFFIFLNNNDITENNILKEKIDEINILINTILNKKNNNNIFNQENNVLNSKDELFHGNEISEENNNIEKTKNNQELIKNVAILTEKINELEKKIKEKDEYIKYIKKYNIIANNKSSDNKIVEIQENSDLKKELLDKNKVFQGMNSKNNQFKNEIDNLNTKLKYTKNESQLIMEITNLKKINSNLNKKINQLRKKLNSNSNINSSNENDLSLPSSKENYEDLIEQNKKIKLENENLKKENNKKEGEINKLKKEINELNQKIKEKNLNKQINLKSITETGHFNFSKNSGAYDSFNKILIEKQIEISIYKNEAENAKIDTKEIKQQLKEKDSKLYSFENYNILCDKNFQNLQWFLLIPKTIKFSNTYEDLIWVSKKQINNINKFNHFVSEYEEQNKLISDNLLKLEKKEEIISKLKYKLNIFEKNINTSQEISDSNVDIKNKGIEKINQILTQLNDAENKLRLLQIENKQLKEKIFENKQYQKTKKSNSVDDSNRLSYNKNYNLKVENKDLNNKNNENKKVDENEEDEEEEVEDEEYEESESMINDLRRELEKTKIELDRVNNEYNDLSNKFDLLKENLSNLLLKMKIPKKYRNDLTEILKIFEFTDKEILFILNKKGLF